MTHFSFGRALRRPAPAPRRSLQSGTAAVEFALTAPILILLMLGTYDLSNGWITWIRLTEAARTVAQIGTEVAVQADGSNSLNDESGPNSGSAAFAAMPQLLQSSAIFGITMSEVVIKQPQAKAAAQTLLGVTSDCAGCTAYVAWTKIMFHQGGPGEPAAVRPCPGPLTALSGDTDSPPDASLPASAFQPAPLLLVDVTYVFKPLFTSGVITAPIHMRRSSYLAARSGRSLQDQIIQYPAAPQCQIP